MTGNVAKGKTAIELAEMTVSPFFSIMRRWITSLLKLVVRADGHPKGNVAENASQFKEMV